MKLNIKYSLPAMAILIFLAGACMPSQHDTTRIKSVADFVNPLVGTQAATTPTAIKHSVSGSELRGQTFPAVGVPHGMTNWTPQTEASEKKCLPPYKYEDDMLQGFRASHWMSGSCTQDYGSVTIMPIAGKLKVNARERASAFYRDEEHACPDSYEVTLNKYNIHVKMSGTSRAGIMQFQYKSYNKTPYIIIEPNSDEGQGYIRIDQENNMVYGYNPAHRIYQGWGQSAGFKGYFVLQFSKPINVFGTYKNGKITYGQKELLAQKDTIAAFVGFELTQEVVVKVGTSFTGFEGAMANLQAEIPGWDISGVITQSGRAWQRVLSKIEVSGGSLKQKQQFYTALYHSYLLPRVFNDVDGRYVGFAEDSTIHQAADYNYYADYSMWDSYRAVHPLITLLEPEESSSMVRSLLDKAEQGGWLPIFPAWNNYTSAMIGDHAIAMICDSYAKGIRGFDTEKAWKYMAQNAFNPNTDEISYKSGKGRRALQSYLKYNYLPLEEKVMYSFHKEEQVSRTMEYAYDDFVLSQFARTIGKKAEAAKLHARATNWRNVFDPTTGYVRGRFADGSWVTPFDPDKKKTHYITEGTPNQYTWYVPHDVYGLMKAMGGSARFMEKLDILFDSAAYWHGNEPGHQTAYLYAYAGAPWKTQQRIKRIIEDEYGSGPGGLSGNEDAGQMSAWLVFSMMGFYPVCPGTPYYILGTPSFSKVSIHQNNGRVFTITAHNLSAENIYIQSATMNGSPMESAWLSHTDITRGGELIFEMGPMPNKTWGSGTESLPPDVMK